MRNKIRAVFELSIGLLVMAGSAPAAPTLINTCPFVISSPGDYLLSADLVCFGGGGVGIRITSSHVTLKLEGHSMFSAGSMSSAISNSSGGVTATPLTDVHILGPGRIYSIGQILFTTGVNLVGQVTDSEVSGITVQGPVVGISIDGQAFGTHSLTFTKNTLAGGTVGIEVINLTASTISDNVASAYTVGIDIENAGVTGPPIMLSRNIVNGNRNTGVSIDTGFVTAKNNIISGNATVGINVTGGQFATTTALEITNNTVLANGTLDLNDAVTNCKGTVWNSNTFFTANQSCIH
jgi:hypothetical protein